MENMSKIKEILKKVKAGVIKLKNIDPKILKAVLKEQLKQKIIIPVVNFGITVGSWIVLGCLIIGVILLVFAGLIELFMKLLGALQKVVDGFQYIFIGTTADVNDGNIEEVKKELKQMGIDFSEVGYLGAITAMGDVDNVADYRNKLTPDLKQKMADEFTRLDGLTEDDRKKAEDIYLTKYIHEYLKANAQTAQEKNNLTFSSSDGSITLSHTEVLRKQEDSIWDRFKAWLKGSYDLEFNNGKFLAIVGDDKVDITEEVYQMYMPWQYPFTFHNETQSPDVGYLVAKLNKYHKLNLILDTDEIFYIKVDVNVKEGYLEEIDDIGWLDDDEEAIGYFKSQKEAVVGGSFPDNWEAREPMVIVDSITTWNSKYKYKYHYKSTAPLGDTLVYNSNGENSKFTTASKIAVIDKFELVNAGTENAYIKYKHADGEQNITDIGFKCGWTLMGMQKIYYLKVTLEGEQNSDIEISETKNDAGYNEMKNILLPYPTFDEKGEITNGDDVPRYYLANATEENDDGTYNGEPKPLNIKTHAEAIVQGVDEIYRKDKTSKEVLAGPEVKEDANGNKVENAPIDKDQFREMMDTTTPFQPDMSVKMVADIVSFFNDNGVVDISTWFGNGMDSLYANMDTVWFLDAEPSDVAVTYSGSTATFTANAGTVVTSPITGEVEDVINGEIHLIKYGTYEEAVEKGIAANEGDTKIPLMRIIIGNVKNIAVIKGEQVTAGSTRLGVIGEDGYITYEHFTGAMEDIGREELEEEINNMIAIESAQFILPLPVGKFAVTSEFQKNRKSPVTGEIRDHQGIDLGLFRNEKGEWDHQVPIYAAQDGKVVKPSFESDGFGNWVYIVHEGGFITVYPHMDIILTKAGDVKQGDILGFVGETGGTTGPHLHFEIWENTNGTYKSGTAVDPRKYINAFLQ